MEYGKTLFAKEFAKSILCKEEQENSCNKCKSCIEFESNNNPDFIEIFSEDGKLKIEKIREMTSKILEKPIISNKKVYIIKDADTMTKEASNALLKTLEEPPNYITIIMTGTNEGAFLNTIKSRCTKIFFNKIEEGIIKKYLEEEYKIEINENLLKACNGSIQKAIEVNEKREIYDQIQNIFTNKEKYKLIDVIKKLEYIYTNKEEIFNILDFINIILINDSIKDTKKLKYIQVVEQTKKNLITNSNYDMSIDNMIYKIWEE